MFSLFDTLGQAVGRFGKFPDDGMSDAFRDKVMAYQGKLLANRTCSRFAFFRVWGMSLIYTELGRIGVRSVSLRSARSYRLRTAAACCGGCAFPGSGDSLCRCRFIGSSYLCAVLGRKLDMGTVDPDRRARETRLIRVYDWNGVHRCDLLADIPLLNLCVSSDDRYIIGLFSEDGEIRCCRLDLPEALYR